ncbi:MAG: isochorismatase family protein [Bradyrhizobium sp.]
MPSAASLGTSANSSSVPIVVFMDMQREYLAKLQLLAISQIDRALDKCRKVLDHSRKTGLPVAFIRVINELAFFNPLTPSVRWIKGFGPCRDELVFERTSPSCYSSEPFTALVNRSRGGFGLRDFQEMSLCDASARHALDEMPAGDVHRAVSKISGICAEVFETDDWIEQTLPRNLGYGKNAGG